jgi:phosphatidylglycerophosphate synthase
MLGGLALVVALALVGRARLGLSDSYLLRAGALFTVVALAAMGFLQEHHPFDHFGAANLVTTARAALVALTAGLIGEPAIPLVATVSLTLSLIVTAMDGVDGWIARRTQYGSAFGARFDMETDALLILALTLLVWRHDKAGAWVLASGLLRYAFVAAGWLLPWLTRPLFPSVRRQAVCVLQVGALILVMAPAVTPPLSSLVAAVALATLSSSFLVDTLWLWRHA